MIWVYKETEKGVFTTGYYDPVGTWHGDADHDNREAAAIRVGLLNGGVISADLNRAVEAIVGVLENGIIVRMVK